MPEPKKARIIISKGKREDLRPEMQVYDVGAERLAQAAIPGGVKQAATDVEVMKLKESLERAGHRVEVIER